MQNHEYALLGGVNRAKIGRYLSLVAAVISAAIVFVLLTAVDIAHQYELPVNLPPAVLSLVGAGAVFSALYWLFDRYVWRWPLFDIFLKVPDLRGDWRCTGQTLNPDGTPSYTWDGTITIVQSWDKLRVRLKTKQSGSNSITAAVIYDDADGGYQLLYNYKNDPSITEPDLKSHLGFASLTFSKDLKMAQGEYFNGHGRFTFGTLTLARL